MANNFIENKDRWLQIANNEFEYPILFIKAWLPFNAWYCNNYFDLKNNDRKILTEIKSDNNLFKTRLISLLDGNDDDSIFFRQNLVRLNKQLEKCKVPSIDNCISFKSINFRKNPTRIFRKVHSRCAYKIELIPPSQTNNYRVKIDILNSLNNTIFVYQHSKYDRNHLINDSGFEVLNERRQKIVLEGFESINPKFKESLILEKKKDSLKSIQEVMFIKDLNLLAQSIIEVIYNIRCILFHGEIQPNKDNLKIYEPAFHMLKLLIKSLV